LTMQINRLVFTDASADVLYGTDPDLIVVDA
jgi:hypothetical protein